jgi:hypothetical protein
MVVESRLDRAAYVRIVLFRRFTNTVFYLFALIGAALTAYTFSGGGISPLVALTSWIPLVIYSVLSIANALMSSRGTNRPFLQQTRYEFGQDGIKVSNRLGDGEIPWAEVKAARKLLGCYVIDLQTGQYFAVPTSSVRQPEALETILRERIKPQLGIAA